MVSLNSSHDLEVWKRSIELVEQVYMLVKQLPREEIYALSDHMRSDAVSMSRNIAAGANRNTTRDYVQFLYISLGSASELETQMIIKERIGFFRELNKLMQLLI